MSRRQSSPHLGSGGRSGSNNELNASTSSTSTFGGHSAVGAPGSSGMSNATSASNSINEPLGGGLLGNPLGSTLSSQLTGSLGRHAGNKRPIALNGIGATVDNKNVDFLCPICFDLIIEAHITRCGHTFCYRCILKSVELLKRCPKCSNTIASPDQVFPNYLLDELIAKYKIKMQIQEKLVGGRVYNSLDVLSQCNATDGDVCDSATASKNDGNDGLKNFLTTESQKLTLPDVRVILDILTQRKQILEAESCIAQNRLLYDFLKQLLLQKEKKRSQIEKEIALIKTDMTEVETVLKDVSKGRGSLERTLVSAENAEDVTMGIVPDPTENISSLGEMSPSVSISDNIRNTDDDGFNTLKAEPASQTYISRKRRMYAHFDDFVTSYFSIRNRDLLFGGSDLSHSQNNMTDQREATSPTTELLHPRNGRDSASEFNHNTKKPRNTLNVFRENLVGFSKYNTLRPLAQMHYASDLHNNSTIVSTIVFDKDNEFFAIGGVTRRIKVFDYLAVVRDTVDIHYPNVEMVSGSKISCITWNSYHKNIMASSDYEGAVNLWDVQTGVRTKCFHEHEKRCWSVDFNDVDSRLIASGSDDARVKLWTLNDEHSVATLEAKANVCCVKFNPKSSCHLAFGSADHDVHYYDLRNMNKPLCIFKGHKKAVSYVKFLNTNEIISASTDSQLKLWNVNEPPYCLRSFVGHVNEKNFVGLATDGDYIACGSEDNALYIYYKGLSKQLFSYKIEGTGNGSTTNTTGNGLGSRNTASSSAVNDVDRFNDVNEFVSAVCWRKQCNVVLAANSRGIIKVLELV